MSAIWGCVDFSGEPLPEGLCETMRDPFYKYKIDRYEQVASGNVVMGCGIQYIQPEAGRERLPIFDSDTGLYFTADCFIDNRDELIRQLGVQDFTIPDGELFFEAYKRWGEDTPKHVFGTYSFAAYDTKTNTLMISADHTFSRSIYYAHEGSRVYFSTLIRPILRGRKEALKSNGQWICGYLGQPNLAVLTEPVETAYDGVKKVVSFHYMRFTERESKSVQFWYPEKTPPLDLKNDDEYKARFLSIMETAAEQATRASAGVGIFLSSGMDSATVAAFAAPVLAKRGKKLYSYTSIPLPEYESNRSWASIVDETEGVKAICEMYPNIRPVLDAQPDRDAFSKIGQFVDIFEQPFKAVANTPWLEGFTERAASENMRIILTGQNGNTGLSFGDIQTYVKTNFARGRFTRIAKFFRRFGLRTGVKWIRTFFYFLPYLIPRKLQLLLVRDYLKCSFLRQDTAKAFGIGRKSAEFESNAAIRTAYTIDMFRALMVKPDVFSHIGEAETKMGLKHGVLYRDITKDVNLLSYCLGAPLESFVSDNGVTRRLVRSYMRGRLPPMILYDEFRRGVQSADWLARLGRRWDEIYPDLAEACRDDHVKYYADLEKTRSALSQFHDAPPSEQDIEFMNLLFTYVLSVFMEQVSSL